MQFFATVIPVFLIGQLYANATLDAIHPHNMLRMRMEILKKFVSNSLVGKPAPLACNNTKYMIITEYQFGRSGNNLVEFTHLIWLSSYFNATFIPPTWMMDVLTPFNTSILESAFCLHLRGTAPTLNATVIEVTSEDSFFLPNLWSKGHWNPYGYQLPPLDSSLIFDLSRLFLKVYAALWSNPVGSIQSAGENIISHHLDGNFRYTSVHKRQMEGGCSKVMNHVSKVRDFSPLEIPTWRPEWSTRSHPLCDMPMDFIADTQTLHNRNGSKVFIAFDGRGEMESYRQRGVVFSADVLPAHHSEKSPELKYVDMFVAIHGDLFLLNPRSTFS
jgi:uncharacterized protein YceK